MKKHFAILTATLLAVSLSACNTTGSSTGGNTSTSEITTSTSIVESSSSNEVTSSSSSAISSSISSSSSVSSSSSSISSSSSSSTSSSVETPKEVKIGEVYTSNYWDITINNMTQKVLGNLWEKVPVFTATRYEALMGYSDGQVLTFQIKCYGANANSAVRLYKERMEAYGYYFSAENNYGYQMVDYYSDLFLAYNLVTENTEVPYFVIQSNVQQTREKEWSSLTTATPNGTPSSPRCPSPTAPRSTTSRGFPASRRHTPNMPPSTKRKRSRWTPSSRRPPISAPNGSPASASGSRPANLSPTKA